MVSALELMAKFGPALEVAPWGSCLVVQGVEFDPDWEAELADQGYNCHEGIQDDYPVTYIQLEKLVASEKAVYVPPSTPKKDFVNKSGFQKGQLVSSSRNTKRKEVS